MAALTEALTMGSRAVVNQTVTGLGGIGKTQLAAHVAHAMADRFRIVWWIEAEHRSTIEVSFRELGRALGLGEDPSSTEVLAWLSSLDGAVDWLLIYDNAESPQSLQGLLPTRGSGSVLITTRCHDWPAWASVLRLGPLSDEAAAGLLTGKTAGGDARRIARMLGCLPLALRQAAAQIRAGIPLDRYEELLRSRFVDAAGSPVPLPDYHHSIVEVVLFARSAAAKIEPESSRLLLLLSFMAADDVSGLLLRMIPADDRLADPLVMARSLTALKRFSLVTEVDGEGRAYAVHRLVQEVVRSTGEDQLEDVTGLALRTLTRLITGEHQVSTARMVRVTVSVRPLIQMARRLHPRTAVELLGLLHSPAVSSAGRATLGWAARAALEIIEEDGSFSDDELQTALIHVHRAEQRWDHTSPGRTFDTTPIRRALEMQRAKDPHGSATVAELQLELAQELAQRDLAEAAALIESAISMWNGDEFRVRRAEAHVLHASVTGHLGLVDEAVAESFRAIRLMESDGSLWAWRAQVAEALLKFGRVADARSAAEPLFDRRPPRAANTAGFSDLDGELFGQIYPRCLFEQRDWAALVKYARVRLEESESSFLPIGLSPRFKPDHSAATMLRSLHVLLEMDLPGPEGAEDDSGLDPAHVVRLQVEALARRKYVKSDYTVGFRTEDDSYLWCELPDPVDSGERELETVAIRIGERTPRWARYAVGLAESISETDPARARELLERAAGIYSEFYGPHHSMTQRAYRLLTA
ncbi:hypothetical protein AB0M02_26715 [Actinoplanes sp. NPDC051861]|uniref:DUF7779 domain-containing protein n=1 Tax=Actinoplanes sp. NPDC051861 TaxID=3155170 RepID=UPI003443DAF3